jgi:hypothetical protein
MLAVRDAAIDAITADLAAWYDQAPFAEVVHRLGAYRGITHLGGLTLAAEVCDWRRFAPRRGVHGLRRIWCPASTPQAARPAGGR